jgi:pyrroloquinoline quinone biosynthesis protein D
MMSAESRPRLAAKARLRFDRRTNRHLLLYPERGLELNATAAEIVKLCTGTHTVRAILAHLAATPGAPPPDVVAHEALAFLDRLAARGLLRDEP